MAKKQRLCIRSIAFFRLRPITCLRRKAHLKKIVVLGGKEEEISLAPKDIIAWRNELEIFTALDVINKPINRSYYTIKDLSDSRSNLKVKAFSHDRRSSG